MSLPELLTGRLEGEEIIEQIPLGGDDVLVVTPTQTVVYRAEGLLSDESVETYSHQAEKISVSVGRRKAKITLKYGLDGEDTLALPVKKVDTVLEPLVAGVLKHTGAIEPDETVFRLFRFSDLSLVITSSRLVKHIGTAVWDLDAEQYHYDDVTDLTFEDGSVATSIVLTLNGRQERFKTPNEDARAVSETLSEVICAHHDVESLEEFRLTIEEQAEDEPEEMPDDSKSSLDFGDGLTPLGADRNDSQTQSESEGARETTARESTTGHSQSAELSLENSLSEAEQTEADAFEGSPFESAGPVADDELTAQVKQLTETIEKQAEQIERQGDLLQTLIEELRRGR